MTQQAAPRPVRTDDQGTMAEETAAKRWPDIIQRLIPSFQASCEAAGGDRGKEGETIIAGLHALVDAIRSNETIRPMTPDGRSDNALYEKELQDRSPCTWLAAEWLFAECYMYRYIETLFATSQHWRGHDIFQEQKSDTFHKSSHGVEELANRFMDILGKDIPDPDSPAGKALFTEMLQIALWGNATDLSLLSKLSTSDIQKLQGAAAILSNQDKIVADDTAQVWRTLTGHQPGRIDIVLDNSGFEFLTDLVLAAYLLEAKLATSIHFHVKDYPWFVSDVTAADVEIVLSDLENPDVFSDRKGLDPLSRLLRRYYQEGRLVTVQHSFWTTSVSFQEMPRVAPDLVAQLRESTLVIFKGDLNYRKLLADKLWQHTTPFAEALGTLGPKSGLSILALRTNKADVCVGLSSEQQVQELEAVAPESAWIKNGKYGVISCSLSK